MSDATSNSSHSGADEQTLDSDHSPSKYKRKKKNPLQGAEKQTVLNIHKQVRESWPGESRSSKSEIAKKTAEVAGISVTTVYSVLREYRTEGCVRSPPHRRRKRKKTDSLDDITLEAIRSKVKSISDEELPTLDKILEAINTDDSLPNFSRSGLYRLLNDTLKLHVKMSRKSKPFKITNDGYVSLNESPQQDLETEMVVEVNELVQEPWSDDCLISLSDIVDEKVKVEDNSCAEYKSEAFIQSPHKRRKNNKKIVDDTLGPVEKIIINSDPFPNIKRLKQNPLNGSEKETGFNIYKHVQETWPEGRASKSEIAQKTADIADNSCAEYKTEACIQSPRKRRKNKKKIVDDTLGPVEKIIINSDPFPNIKRLKQNPLNGSEKETVINIYKHVQETWPEGRASKSEIAQKTADIAGICRTTVYKVLKEYKTEGCVQSPPHRRPKRKKIDAIDDITLEAIRKKADLFSDKSLDQILEAINSDESLPNFSRTGLYRLLNDILKFNITTRRKKKSLINN